MAANRIIGFGIAMPTIPVGGAGVGMSPVIGIHAVIDIPTTCRCHIGRRLECRYRRIAQRIIQLDLELVLAVEEGQQIEGIGVQQIKLDSRLHALLLRGHKGTVERHALEGQIGGIFVEIAGNRPCRADQLKRGSTIKGGARRDDMPPDRSM